MLLTGIIFNSLILWLVNLSGLIHEKTKSSSMSYETLEAIPAKAKLVGEKFKPVFSRYWKLLEESTQEKKSATPE